MLWGTYVTLLVQLFLLIPIFVLLYKCSKRLVYSLLFVMVLGGASVCFYVIYTFEFIPGYLYIFDIEVVDAYAIKPYCRIDSLAIGMIMGFYNQEI